MIAPVLFAATLLHAKPSHLEAKSSPEVGSGSGRQAPCSLGVVVKAAPKRRSRRSGHSMQHSCENYPAVTVEGKKSTLTYIRDSTLELQTHKRDSREEKNTNNPTCSHGGGSAWSRRKARPFRPCFLGEEVELLLRRAGWERVSSHGCVVIEGELSPVFLTHSL